MLAYLDEMGVSPDILDLALQIPSDRVRILSPNETLAIRIATERADARHILPRTPLGLGNGVTTPPPARR